MILCSAVSILLCPVLYIGILLFQSRLKSSLETSLLRYISGGNLLLPRLVSNESLPRTLRLSGRISFSRLSVPAKASAPISVIPSDIIMVFTFLPTNNPLAIRFILWPFTSGGMTRVSSGLVMVSRVSSRMAYLSSI